MTRAFLLSVILITSCRSRLIELPPGDGGNVTDASAPPDLLPPICLHHTIEFVTLDSLEQVDSQMSLHLGEAVRVRIGIPMRAGCDSLGDVTTDIMVGNATDFARISARVWKGSMGCGDVHSVKRVVTLDGTTLSNFMLQVHDGAPGGTLALQIMPKGPLSTDCKSAFGIGANCQLDCQCENADSRARCVPGTMAAACAIPCNEDVECPSAQPHCHQAAIGPGITSVCDADKEGCCAAGCPFGQACDSCVCKSITHPSNAACICDRDCASGELCSDEMRCLVPCTEVAECAPGQNVCGGGQCSDTK